MRSRLAQPAKSAFWALFTLAACAAPLMAADSRISFQVATGSSAGTYFPVGEAIAGLVSHPPGIGRCEVPGVCGPAGLIASARTSQGSFDNLAQVESGAVDSGLAQSDIVAAAIKGEGIFKKDGPRRHVRVIASLFEEDVHLVASTRSRIKSVSDLRGKRVALGLASSGIGFTAREIFAAWGVAEKSVRLSNQDTQTEVAAMKAGTLDAFFMVGGVPESALSLTTGLVRPFGYYDGMLFEVSSAALGPERLVAAGGRYDGLPARLGGPEETRAVGCIVRPGRAWKEGAA